MRLDRLALNRRQTMLLFCAAFVIALLLVIQISEVGLAESNWIVGILVVVTLLIIATNGQRERSANGETTEVAADYEISVPSKVPVPLDAILTDAKEQFSTTFLRLHEEAKPPGVSMDFGIPMGPATDPLAWKSAYMIVFLSLAKRNPRFEDTADASKLAAKTAVEIASSTKRLQAAINDRTWSITDLKPDDMKKYLNEVVECRFRVVKTMRLLAQNVDAPLDPIFSLIAKEFPFGGSTPEARERAYGGVARNIMRDLTR